MANLFFKKLFGQIPSTEKYITQLEKGRSDLKTFDTIAQSSKLQRYTELKSIVENDAHIKFRTETNQLKYKKSVEYNAEKEFGKIAKNKKFRLYLQQQTEGIELNAESNILISKYNQLKDRIESQEFADRKNFLTNPKRYETTKEYRLDIEFENLKSDTELIWYFKMLKKNDFEKHREWALVFEENFDALDTEKWLTIPFYGMVSLNNNSYVTDDNLQFHTDNKNLNLSNSAVTIETREEKVSGRKWNVIKGFRMSDFDYTSGMLNTGHNFRFQEGLVEIVASMTEHKETVHSVSLKADMQTPHIDLFCSGSKKGIKTRLFLNNGTKPDFEETISGLNFSSNLHYSLEWSANKLTWRINGYTIAEYQGKLPQKALYLSLSSILLRKPSVLPAYFTIDSVKVFAKQQ